MVETKEELAIDIGGGFGEYFVEEARKRPNVNFLILEPRGLKLRRFPPNLHIVRWRSDTKWEIPLPSGSVDEANMNFLMGEMTDKRGSIGIGDEIQQARYQELLRKLKRTLKKGGILKILEPQSNVGYIEELLYREGYTIVKGPDPLEDVERTHWSKTFYDMFKKSGKSLADSFAYPMVIEARR